MHGDHHPHDILLCIGTGKTVNDRDRLRYHGDQFYLKTAAEMCQVFAEVPEALANTVRIAERCQVDIPSDRNHLPNFAVPPPYSLNEYFEHVVREGFKERLPRLTALRGSGVLRHSLEEYESRLTYEIEMIKRMDTQGYFLIVWDFIRYAREKGIPVGPGRGSAAGSLVAYSLRITDVDPLDYDLIFERFLNPERVSLPDIDIDFCERRRGEVIEYVTQKYGRENVAQIITFGTMKARAVVRDVGRSLDIPFADVDRVAKLIPADAGHDAGQGARRSTAAEAGERAGRACEGAPDGGAAARRDDPPRISSCRRSRYRAEVDHRVRAALQGEERRNYDPVGDEGDRAHWPPEDGLSRPQHVDAAQRRGRADQGHDRQRARSRCHSAGRSEDVSDLRRRGDLRHLPVRKLGHAGHPSQGEAAAPRRSDCVECAVSARSAPQRHGGRFHRSKARQGQGHLRGQGARADSRRYLRRHRLSGTGDADCERAGRIHARRSGSAAKGHGKEEGRRHAGAAHEVRQRALSAAASTRKRRRKSST